MVCDSVKPDIDSFGSPFFFFSNNESSEILYVSPSVRQVLGYSPNEVVGRKYSDFIDAESSLNESIVEHRERRFRGDGAHLSYRAVWTRSRKKKILKIQTFGSVDEKGTVTVNHGIAEDVSEKYNAGQEASRRLEYLEGLQDSISDRESTVLELVTQGRLNKSIARELAVSERAVEQARSRLMKKFGANSTAEMISMAAELDALRKWIQPIRSVCPLSENPMWLKSGVAPGC